MDDIFYTNHPRFSCNQSFKGSPSNSYTDGNKTWATLPPSMSPSTSPDATLDYFELEINVKNKLGLSCAKFRVVALGLKIGVEI